MEVSLVQEVCRNNPCAGENCADLPEAMTSSPLLCSVLRNVDKTQHGSCTCVCMYVLDVFMYTVFEHIIAVTFLLLPLLVSIYFSFSVPLHVLSFMPMVFFTHIFPFFHSFFPLSFLFWLFILYYLIYVCLLLQDILSFLLGSSFLSQRQIIHPPW